MAVEVRVQESGGDGVKCGNVEIWKCGNMEIWKFENVRI